MNYTREFPLTTEDNYPYTGKDGNCNKAAEATGKYFVTDVNSFGTGNDALYSDLINEPVAVSVRADDWHCYAGGIMVCKKYEKGTHNHAVVVVGFGTEEATGVDYWIV